jgi:lysine 6-dehydrogenase
MKILIVGSGWMGSAVAYDLKRFGEGHTVALADLQSEQLVAAKRLLENDCETHILDCADVSASEELFRHYNVIISAVPYRFNAQLAQTAVRCGCHLLDLGGNSEIVREELALHPEALDANVTVVADCGLAPGLSNILAMHGFRQLEEPMEIHACVGGLPQNPQPPLMYQLIFSAEGLLNEYLEPAEIIENGKRIHVESMTGLEPISFGGTYDNLEVFYTSGGLSLLPEQLEGKIKTLTYKTIRYTGHCERFKMLIDIGFAGSEPVMVGGGVHTSRELFTQLLRKKLSGNDPDIVFFRVDVSGHMKGEKRLLRYEMIDHFDMHTGMTAMMRTTAFPVSVMALMIADGSIRTRGAYVPHDIIDGDDLIAELAKRNITIKKQLIQLS